MKLIDYLPEFMQVYKEMQEIMGISQKFIDDLDVETENFLLDLFIFDATKTGVKHYEEMLNITPKLTETLDDRKYTLFLKYNETLPYTYRKLIEILNTVCGEGNYTISISVEKLNLKVRINLNSKHVLENVRETLENIVPMNVFLDLDLLYNRWNNFKLYTWASLKAYNWGEMKEVDLDG